jgi:isopenicillin N synthase-like dioxygenase
MPIAVLDFQDWKSESSASRRKFVNELGNAFEEIGFVILANHDFPSSLRKDLYEAFRKFFALPEEVKKKYEREDLAGQRGYTSKNKEHAKDRNVPDLKEFYQIGQEIVEDHYLKTVYPPNIWPEEVPELRDLAVNAFRRLEAIGRELLKAIALYLDLQEDFFEPHVHYGDSILRAIHYYPIEDPTKIPPGALRAAEHEDINLITLLMGSSAEGLQALSKKGEWIPIEPEMDELVINVGDMLQRLTNNRLRSTTHRVVNPPPEKLTEPRYSIPFFLHPKSDMSLACLPSCVSETNPKQYSDVTAGEYLRERLREIGLLKK